MIETFSLELEKINKQSSNTGNSARVYHPFYLSTKTNKVFRGQSYAKGRSSVGGSEDSGNSEERCYFDYREYRKSSNSSSLFLEGKKDGETARLWSAIVICSDLKDLNKSILCANSKMEGLFLLKELLMPGDLMRKTELKNPYFAVTFAKSSRKYVRFW